jgi:hypothetical protein
VTWPNRESLKELPERVQRAIWEGDVDWLSENLPCACCCAEHTYGNGCPAYAWGGCRGQGSMSRQELASWQRHYAQFHGLSEDEFWGLPAAEKAPSPAAEEWLDATAELR